MATTKVGFSGLRKRGNVGDDLEKMKLFVWDSKNREVLGRDPIQLVLYLGYILALWAAVLALMAVMMALFLYVVVDANYPMLDGMDSLIKANPGMMVRPLPDRWTKLIRFEQGIPSTYKIYTDHIQTFIDQYENDKQVGENFIDCSKGKTDQQIEKVCRFNVDDLGADCTWQQDYGFDEGTPCILLKLNKIYGWEPTAYDSENVPDNIKNGYRSDHISVTCEGETPVDKENIGTVTFHPPNGFPFYYYPYVNQEGYRQPIIFARFENATNGVLINVWCKAWASNINHHRTDNSGSIHFELLID